jgi:hypothetical protein
MLDTSHRANLNDLLASLEDRIQLPEEWRDYFSESGVLPAYQNESRRFVRRRIRARVVLELGQTLPAIKRDPALHCVYLRDVSRTGVSFLHADELFPAEDCEIWLPQQKLHVTIVRCRRKTARCYLIGARMRSC